MTKLSIITINLNDSKGLKRTFNSVRAQRFTDYEYIVIDGGSVDGFLDIIKEYEKMITFWVSEPDKGIYNAFNKGILKAKGEYILFLNAGDCIHDASILEKVFSEENTADIIYGAVNLIYPDKIKTYYPLREEELILSNFNTNEKATLLHPASFLKKRLFEKNLYDENYKILGDVKFFIDQIIFLNCSVKYIPEVLTDFYADGISNNPKYWPIVKAEREKMFKEFLPPRILKDYELIYQIKDLHLKKYLPFLNKTSGFQLFISKMIGLTIGMYKLLRPRILKRT